ncbi:MAG TPA: Hsp33 family molecular chaperone HslO, partial [Verrucomicrobiae bacterium]|nr:Hsp33 family molecular chaperone HslO [Verrucomicrobiae bacterium]
TRSENVRALACLTTGLVNEGIRRHATLPTASAALGRALTAGALMGSLLKTRQRVALKFEGSGPMRKIIVEAESNGAVRGYVAVPEVFLTTPQGGLDVAGALGRAGFLTVTKDLGMREPYTSTVQLYTSEIAEDLALYLTESEQVPSAVGLGVCLDQEGRASAAGGFLIQSLPPRDEEIVEKLMAHIAGLPPLSELLAAGKTPEELLALLFGDIEYQVLEKRELAYRCSCSRERIERILISLGGEELTDIVEQEGFAQVTCEFCRESYRFERAEVERLRELATAH